MFSVEYMHHGHFIGAVVHQAEAMMNAEIRVISRCLPTVL